MVVDGCGRERRFISVDGLAVETVHILAFEQVRLCPVGIAVCHPIRSSDVGVLHVVKQNIHVLPAVKQHDGITVPLPIHQHPNAFQVVDIYTALLGMT